jgi:hypothetical protein
LVRNTAPIWNGLDDCYLIFVKKMVKKNRWDICGRGGIWSLSPFKPRHNSDGSSRIIGSNIILRHAGR